MSYCWYIHVFDQSPLGHCRLKLTRPFGEAQDSVSKFRTCHKPRRGPRTVWRGKQFVFRSRTYFKFVSLVRLFVLCRSRGDVTRKMRRGLVSTNVSDVSVKMFLSCFSCLGGRGLFRHPTLLSKNLESKAGSPERLLDAAGSVFPIRSIP